MSRLFYWPSIINSLQIVPEIVSNGDYNRHHAGFVFGGAGVWGAGGGGGWSWDSSGWGGDTQDRENYHRERRISMTMLLSLFVKWWMRGLCGAGGTVVFESCLQRNKLCSKCSTTVTTALEGFKLRVTYQCFLALQSLVHKTFCEIIHHVSIRNKPFKYKIFLFHFLADAKFSCINICMLYDFVFLFDLTCTFSHFSCWTVNWFCNSVEGIKCNGYSNPSARAPLLVPKWFWFKQRAVRRQLILSACWVVAVLWVGERESGEIQTGQGREFRQLHPVSEERMESFSLRLANASS